MVNSIINKIITNNDKFVVFYSDWCMYSLNAIKLLKTKNRSFKGYLIESIEGDMDTLLDVLKKHKEKINFNELHKTRPIIFYKGKFLGGYTELKQMIDN